MLSIAKTVTQELKNISYYAVQLYESTDVANLTILCSCDTFLG
jgi:hypothetical protein